MAGIRESIRSRIPFSTEIYERMFMRRGMAPTQGRVKALIASGNPIKLDIGGADAGSNGWTTLDITRECDLFWDLRRGIPFPDSTVDAVYSSHFFEHLSYAEGQEILREGLRVLKPGGTFSVCVPNARMYIEAYLGIREVPDSYFAWKPAMNQTTAIDAINYVAYMGGEHKYMFDIDNLLHLLAQAGFVDVQERDFEPGLDREERDFESIYAIGVKP
ncbi:MAG: class I SAM-dependent methyltransferase [Actinomycetes bacterium]